MKIELIFTAICDANGLSVLLGSANAVVLSRLPYFSPSLIIYLLNSEVLL